MNQTVKTVVHDLEKLKLTDIKSYDLSRKSIIADYFVIATAESLMQLDAARNRLLETLGKLGIRLRNPLEGFDGGWLLLDFGNVIIHVFLEEMRAFYHLDAILEDAQGSDVLYEEVTARKRATAPVKKAKTGEDAGRKAVKNAEKTSVRKKKMASRAAKTAKVALEQAERKVAKKAAPKKTASKSKAPAVKKTTKTSSRATARKPAPKKK
jgi:ribosome-associated protein